MGAGFARLVEGAEAGLGGVGRVLVRVAFPRSSASTGSRGLWPRSYCLDEGPSDVEAWGSRSGEPHALSPPHQLVSAGVGTLPILVDPWAQK